MPGPASSGPNPLEALGSGRLIGYPQYCPMMLYIKNSNARQMMNFKNSKSKYKACITQMDTLSWVAKYVPQIPRQIYQLVLVSSKFICLLRQKM